MQSLLNWKENTKQLSHAPRGTSAVFLKEGTKMKAEDSTSI